MFHDALELVESKLGVPRHQTDLSARWVCREHGAILWFVLSDREGRVIMGLEGHHDSSSDLAGIRFIEARTLADIHWLLDRVSCIGHG
jgi:hypothetical protein